MGSRPELFVDTSGWACYYDLRQPSHEDALLFYRLAVMEERSIVTTNYVLSELISLLTSPLRIPRPEAIKFLAGIRASPHVEIVFETLMNARMDAGTYFSLP